MKKEWTERGTRVLVFGLTLALGASLAANAALAQKNRTLSTSAMAQRQREMSDVVAAMADIEVNLAKLLLASGAQQSVALLGETAMLAQHVSSGLSRLPLRYETASGAMKFAGQMEDYALALAVQVSGGGMLTSDDEVQIAQLLTACRALNEHLTGAGEKLYAEDMGEADVYADAAAGWQDETLSGSEISYPSLIYDGPFSDGRQEGEARGLTGEAITREQARQAAARFAGTTADRVTDAADSGGRFEAFGFTAQTESGRLSVQVTGQGGHLLWMMPEQASYAGRMSREDCLRSAQIWLADVGFGEMEACFVQAYDGMVVANFAAVQDGVLLYPDQVKVQVSMDSGAVVGAECSLYLTNHVRRAELTPGIDEEQARQMLSGRLDVQRSRLCVIPQEAGERLCWGFEGTFGDAKYYVFIDARTGEAADILRVAATPDGETAI